MTSPAGHALIRPAITADISALVALEAGFPEEDRFSRRTWQRLLKGNAAVLLAESAGSVTGAAVTLFRAGTTVARLYSISVSDAARGSGLSSRLLEESETISRQNGSSWMRLEVRETNVRAIRLYERHGYRVMARAIGYYPDGEAALRMEKPLDGLPREDQ